MTDKNHQENLENVLEHQVYEQEDIKDPVLKNLLDKLSGMSMLEIAKSYLELNNRYQDCLRSLDIKNKDYSMKMKDYKKDMIKNVFYLFLDVLKVFEISAYSKEDKYKIIKEAFSMFNSKVKKFFESNNISVIVPSENENFNYKIHEAISTVKTSLEDNDQKIASVIDYGFSMDGEVILPAKVIVYSFEKD
ncbi:MAG: nucleotide exchange factor GrpE [Candidatus Aenigmatarchaeota archaeon]